MFYVARITGDQIRGGILFQIGDAMAKAFSDSATAIYQGARGGTQDKLLILFENSMTNPDFSNDHNNGIQDVLYFNESAKEVVTSAGLDIQFLETVEQPPESCGIMNQTYRFINFR